MATQAALSFSILGTLARRFAGQVLLSGSVMLALNAASHIDLGLSDAVWPGLADQVDTAPSQREAMVLPVLDMAGALKDDDPSERAVAQAPALPALSPADTVAVAAPALREARLPVPARLFGVGEQEIAHALPPSGAPQPPVPHGRGSSPREGDAFELAKAEGVLLFDQCSPACDSRDPLLRHAKSAARAKPALPARTRVADLAAAPETAPSEAIVAEAEMEGPMRPLGTPDAAPGLLSRSLSTARDTTLAAAGSLVRLVSW